MPYVRSGKCVYKKNPDGSRGKKVGCSDTEEKAKAHLRKLYMEEKHALSQFSMAVVKASISSKAEKTMRIRMVNSDTSEDSYEERMSVELFENFVKRIDEKESVPEPFNVICEDGWNGGMPYPSISHFKSGAGKNVPGEIEKVYVDGEKLKSTAILHDDDLGNAVWKSICKDEEEKSLPIEQRTFEHPVRVSIGFLDLEHKHEIEDDEDFIFTRKNLKDKCKLCTDGIKNKTYLDGQLVHLAFTRVPANSNTSVEVYKMGDEIKTKQDDAASIIGEDLVEGLVDKSETSEVLVVKAEKDLEAYAHSVRSEFYTRFEPPRPSLWVRKVTEKNVLVSEEDKLYLVGYEETENEFTFDKRSEWQRVEVGLVPVKSEAEEEWEVKFEEKSESEVVEDVMPEKTVEKEEVQEVVSEPTQEPVAEEKSAVDVAIENFKAKLLEVKDSGASKEEAVKSLQPVLNELAGATERVIDPEANKPMDVTTVRAIFQEELKSAIPELASALMEAMPQASQTVVDEIPVPRSLEVKNALPHEQQKLSQIQQIAQASTKTP